MQSNKVYFQFKSSTVRDSVAIDGHFISVGELKEHIIESKQIKKRGRRCSDSDIVISDYDTKVDYLDDGALIPRHATVLVRRVPVQASLPIIVNPPPVAAEPEEPEVVERDPEDVEWEELVKVINSDPFDYSSQSGNANEMDEDSKIKTLVETPALDWRSGFGPVSGGFGGKTPPQGYVCHRCKVAGHFIQHCPTNGDPDYDIKRLRPPTGIPKSMLVATPDGSYALPTGAVAVLRPNEDAFDRAMEGVPSSTRSVAQLPPELHCRLCKKVMKDAVLTSKCCFDSFCDRCIRERIISSSSCVCGATNVLADDLIPNVTLRNTITRIMESNSSSSSSRGASQIQDSPSTQHSVASQQVLPPPEKQESARLPKQETVSMKESSPAESQGSAPLAEQEVEDKPVSDETPKPVPVAAAHEMQWIAAPENYMDGAYNPYWQPPYYSGVPYYAGFGFGAMGKPFGGQGMMMPPQRDHVDSGMGFKRKRNEDPEMRGSGDKSSSKFRRSDRPYPDRPSHDSQLSKKQEQNNDHGHHRVHHDDHYHKEERHHRDHSHQSSSHNRDHSHRSSSHHRDYSHRSSSHHRDYSHRSSSHHLSESKKRKLSSSSEAAPATASGTRKEERHHRDHSHQSSSHNRDHSHRSSSHHRDYSHRSSSHHLSESKKRKLSSSSEAAPATASGTRKGHYEHKATSVSSSKSTITTCAPASLAYDETHESSDDDDDMNFKRRSSWYKSSPPATMEREREKKHRWQNQSSGLRHGLFQERNRIGGRAQLF